MLDWVQDCETCKSHIEFKFKPPAFTIPIKKGCDAKTLIEDNELFIFEKEVKPILSVLCGKTLEHARMEVLEEEELRTMREQQRNFTDIRNQENMEEKRMEDVEKQKIKDF